MSGSSNPVAPAPGAPVLEVQDLRIQFRSGHRAVEAVRGVSFTVGRERLGIVGESGSGKSATGRAIMRLLPKNAVCSAGRLAFDGRDLLATSESEMCALRGRDIALILQDPRYSLNPVVRVGRQIAEAAKLHMNIGARAARSLALAMLEKIRINDPERVYDLYPHEISGGMGQRVMIAMMLISRPKLVIADEPTSALDVSVRKDVLELLDQLVRENGSGLVLISHDIRMVARFCERIAVMYNGRIVEMVHRLEDASHPYTRALIESIPTLSTDRGLLPVVNRQALARLAEPADGAP